MSKINLRELRDVDDKIKGGASALKANNSEDVIRIEPTTPRKRKQESSYIGDITEDVIVDFNKYPILESYCKIISALQDHHIDEDSQRARHSIAMLKWFVVDRETFVEAGWKRRAQLAAVPVPRIGFKLVSDVLQEHFDDRLRSAAVILRTLKRKGKLDSNDVSWMSPPAAIKQLFSQYSKEKHYDIDVLTAVSVIAAVVLYISTPCRGLGSIPSENHIKAELWGKIFSAAFVLHCSKFIPVWELQHLIPGDGGCGYRDLTSRLS